MITRLFWIAVVSALLLVPDALAQEAAATQTDSGIMRTAFLLTLLAIIPALFVSMTAFIRILVVLAMVRHAFGMPETPPNTVLISLAILLTLFVMGPTFDVVSAEALQPLLNGTISVETAIDRATGPMRAFMLTQVQDQDIATMYQIAGDPLPTRAEDVDILKLTPAFILNELRVSFTIGFIILLPFLLIDIVVASVLLALGMMMVPPATISLPIKLLMFVLIDGWSLVISGVTKGFLN
jgi:flagellar biosynthesis protein FliP